MKSTLNRRTVLRGMIGGAAISIGLPLLDICLNDAFGQASPSGWRRNYGARAVLPGFEPLQLAFQRHDVSPRYDGAVELRSQNGNRVGVIRHVG